jgi:hypothetical protein
MESHGGRSLQARLGGEFALRLHRDERGSMSIVTVFAVMFLVMLLGMVMNVGRHVDGKLRMQNAADSAAYSGGTVLARGMNTLAFSNHLLCDVFALTAFLREARDQNAASFTPSILKAWIKVAPVFSSSRFPKFVALGSAIQQKVPMEQQMVTAYSAWAKAVSGQVLPVMENILAQELIPKYQRAVMVSFPDIAQSAARETAARNGEPEHRRGPMFGVLWRTDGQPVGGDAEATYAPDERTLPVVDAELDTLPNQKQYAQLAVAQRRSLAHRYLDLWNDELLSGFDQLARMSQFSGLYRSFTCGYLEHLLNVEYPTTNLLFMIRGNPLLTPDPTATLAQHYTFISVVYWKKLPETAPGLFKNPLEADDQAFAEVHLFIPRDRLGWVQLGGGSGGGGGVAEMPLGGVPGEIAQGSTGAQGSNNSGGGGGGNQAPWVVARLRDPPPSRPSPSDPSSWRPPPWDPFPLDPPPWDLLDERWDCQLAPVTQTALATILQTNPNLPDFDSGQYTLPDLGGVSSDDLQQISPH